MKVLHSYLVLSLLISCQVPSNKAENMNAPAQTLKAKLFQKFDAELGEGAIWNHQTQELYWVDIEGRKLHVLNPQTRSNRTWDMPKRIGTVVPIDKYRSVVALEDEIHILNMTSEKLLKLTDVQAENQATRLNDGKCDPGGRLWVGTMDYDVTHSIGQLYMVAGDGTVQSKVDSLIISNGIVWTSDQKTMYHAETIEGIIRAFDYDAATGTVTNERVIIRIPEELGLPDGMAIDEEDNIWVCLWDGNAVVRYDPETGDLMQRIEVPAHNITSCAFGGADLDTLFITSSKLDMTASEHEKYPDAGSIFAVVPGVKGVKSTFFKLAD